MNFEMLHAENQTMLRVYFDSNAMNYLFDEFKGKSKRPFGKYDIMFSWPLLDEIKSCSSLGREIDLAKFMWQISNRKMLITIEELMFMEVQSLFRNKKILYSQYFESDTKYLEAWKEDRKGSTPNHVRIELRSAIRNEKEKILSQLREGRKRWLPKYRSNVSLPDNWISAYPLLASSNHFNELIFFMMETFGLLSKFENPKVILNFDYRKLPCTSVGVEFIIALMFLIDSQSKRLGSPDLWDIYDMKHSFYVGLSDYFVTNDRRMYFILHDLLDTKSAKIISSEEFSKELLDC
jgi:hypothetical protein